MTSSALALPTPWIQLRDAWTHSPWSSRTLLEFAKRGVLEARLDNGTWCFEPQGFYMAMREELALDQWEALRDVARRYDVAYEALVALIEDYTLYALYTDTDWYIEPGEADRVPGLLPDAMTPTPGKSAPRELKETPPPPPVQDTLCVPCDTPTWMHFKLAVRQSAFTHAELHYAVRTGQVDSKRHAQGYLLVCMQSLSAFTPDARWLTFEAYTHDMSNADRRLVFRQLHEGQREARLMGGTWYLLPSTPVP